MQTMSRDDKMWALTLAVVFLAGLVVLYAMTEMQVTALTKGLVVVTAAAVLSTWLRRQHGASVVGDAPATRILVGLVAAGGLVLCWWTWFISLAPGQATPALADWFQLALSAAVGHQCARNLHRTLQRK